MKTTTIIIAAVLSFQFNALSADNPGKENAFRNEAANNKKITLVPVTPAEADFSEMLPDKKATGLSIIPVTPPEADFNDNVPEMNMDIFDLAPETPGFADFDEIEVPGPHKNALKPVSPAEADFE